MITKFFVAQLKTFFSWCCGVLVITTAQLHTTKPELRFCAGSNPARGMSEICNGEDLWQWSLLEIRLNAFHLSTIPQEQFNIFHTSHLDYCSKSYWNVSWRKTQLQYSHKRETQQGIGLLRNLSNKFPRQALVTIYKMFIRP